MIASLSHKKYPYKPLAIEPRAAATQAIHETGSRINVERLAAESSLATRLSGLLAALLKGSGRGLTTVRRDLTLLPKRQHRFSHYLMP